MMEKNAFDVRYVKLHFTLEITEDAVLPKYKSSALRGGIGEMLLRANCIRDRKCEECDFETECIVRRVMYPKMEIQPEFMTSGDSVGFVTECEDYRVEYETGDTLCFQLILFGKTICFFSQLLNALYALGMQGLGKEKGRFHIVGITNTKKQPILKNADIDMGAYRVHTLKDYVVYRRKQLGDGKTPMEIKFQSPLTLKYRGESLGAFDSGPIYEAAARRLYALACLEGIPSEIQKLSWEIYPKTIEEEHIHISTKRYSNHRDSAMPLKGIEGRLVVPKIPEEMMDVLLVGELVHIGKNTSFGFGRYRIGGSIQNEL